MAHIKEIDKCCFCGKLYKDYGNSTWGCWTHAQELDSWGEDKRCCNECNIKYIVPARRKKAQLIQEGKIKNVLEDIPEQV